MEDVTEILQEAVTNSWDFREAFYAFCDAISVKAQHKALVEVFRRTTQRKDQTPMRYIQQMQSQSRAILGLLYWEEQKQH